MGKTKTYLPQIKHYYAEDEPVHEMRVGRELALELALRLVI